MVPITLPTSFPVEKFKLYPPYSKWIARRQEKINMTSSKINKIPLLNLTPENANATAPLVLQLIVCRIQFQVHDQHSSMLLLQPGSTWCEAKGWYTIDRVCYKSLLINQHILWLTIPTDYIHNKENITQRTNLDASDIFPASANIYAYSSLYGWNGTKIYCEFPNTLAYSKISVLCRKHITQPF